MSRTTLLWPLLAGISVGWLTGLSASPVLSTVLGALLGLIGGIAAAISGRNASTGLDMRAAEVLLVGVALAAPFGVLTRTYRLLEPNGSAQNIGAIGSGTSEEVARIRALTGALYGTGGTHCDRLISTPRERLRSELRISGLGWAPGLESAIGDTELLAAIVEAICGE